MLAAENLKAKCEKLLTNEKKNVFLQRNSAIKLNTL